MLYRLFDLETVIDPDMGSVPTNRKTGEPVDFPPAPWWRIVAAASIVLKIEDSVSVDQAAVLCGSDERAIIHAFARSQATKDPTIVTFNGRHFDLPVVTARAMRHGVDWSWYWRTRGARYRFDTLGSIDLADELSDFGAGDRTSLEAWARVVNAPSKLARGSDVAAMWAAGDVDQIAEYCFGDVRTLGFVFARWLSTKGTITRGIESNLRGALESSTVNIHRLDLPALTAETPLEKAS